MENLIAKAQFRVLPSKKGIRLHENLSHQLATEASPERAEKKPYAAIAIGAKRWPNYKNHFQWGNSLKSLESIPKQSTNGFIKDGST